MKKVSTEPASVDAREKKIVRTSILGILANTMLAAFKAIVGMATHSIAVVLDAVNNLSDALSSIVTIIGTKLASRNPDKKHPLGHGRIEYLSTTIVSMLVLYAGVTAIVESVKKIIRPEAPDYSPVSLLIISVAVLVKVFLGRYVKSVGEKVNSDSLIASGSDATFDAILSFSVLVTALISLTCTSIWKRGSALRSPSSSSRQGSRCFSMLWTISSATGSILKRSMASKRPYWILNRTSAVFMT